MNKLNQQKEGFTIIEVVLVLAIAALIMLMVFIAWPALQRSQRDTARKNDQSSIASAIATYRSNNNGVLPPAVSGAAAGSWDANFVQKYLTNLGHVVPGQVAFSTTAPASLGAAATQSATGTASTTNPTYDSAVVVLGYDCSGAPSARKAAVIIGVEAGGGNATACVTA